MYESLSYFALLNIEKSPGVDQKIDNLVKAAIDIDINAQKKIFPVSLIGIFNFIRSIVSCRSEIIYIRFSDFLFPFIFLFLCYLRVKGKKVIVDVPTPRIICIKEMEVNIKKPFFKLLRKTLSYISSSWVLFPSNLIIQYADEHLWFSYGTRKKTLKMGNGILIDNNIPLANKEGVQNSINMIAVAQLADWHGYDRLIQAMAIVSGTSSINYNLTVVGEGESLYKLKELTNSLKLKNIIFTGRLVGDDLNNAFENKHVGIASLGLYRIGLHEASVLKTREYMARGLPVITAGNDPDFPSDCGFRFSVSNSSEIDSLVCCLKSLPLKLRDLSQSDIRSYAKVNLSIESKLKVILEAL
ncbi:glycosyltransferase family 4 protein [Colwellia sp. MB02u-18]|uniref:glycosyltransferase n=1 Tax=unclassified Colwellia TaxID=196834 RepID=UPI0015F6CBC5|nr:MULTISPECIES: glycosyltransferase [unclassified Colwellia]MBA6222888.1 glycosyltransferase family 4 protein [Colwellia sp. MB3u-45]MBA6267827.1 glycosyltransferase family 4 protein [Colwellia sp. MB3u-43]MBA6322366.1 glycosyltransferase family 4 protein [Colwellia sp. MB02u-19]MBA6324365.1 glycosyltransferase family 4 protein [Colwellia sp. MB02u-18]MBA6332521.1 glycosyltransferase family 4 protein [Colwellia sp. MB02u-12]